MRTFFFSIRIQSYSWLVAGLTMAAVRCAAQASAFEGCIQAVTARGGAPFPLLYTVDTNWLRIEVTLTNSPIPIDIVDRQSGGLTLIMPQTHCFMRIPPAGENAGGPVPGMAPAGPPGGIPGMSGMPVPPPPQAPPNIGPTNFSVPPGAPPMPAMPAMPMMPAMPGNAGMPMMPAMPMMPRGGALQLRATGEQTNLLGYTCARYELKQWGQTMEIWATDQLLPFQVYQAHQPFRNGPPVIEERWGDLLAAKKLFPLRASLRLNQGLERYHFEVQSITPAKRTNQDARPFAVPPDYIELQPHSF